MNPVLKPDLISDVRQLLQFPFMVNALLAGTIVAVLAATVGWYVLLRREAFTAHTLSVMAFPGAAGAALAGLPTALGYYAACLITAGVLVPLGSRRQRGYAAESAAVGTVQALGLAAGFLFLSLDQSVLGGPETLLFGTFLGITRGQVLTLLIVAAAALAAVAVIARPLLFATVDREVAQASGVRVAAIDAGFLVILALAIAATSQITGALLVFALLVAPPACAQLVTTAPLPGLALSVAIGVGLAWLGLGMAYFSIYPVGFFITTLAFGLYLVLRTGRGLRARAV